MTKFEETDLVIFYKIENDTNFALYKSKSRVYVGIVQENEYETRR